MGLFIVFEGVEGSGKTTQSRELQSRLVFEGYDSLLTHEPGGTPMGDQIHHWLKNGGDIEPMSELFLFSASRSTLVRSIISPSLQRNMIVVCDRYIHSTIAYQGYGRGIKLDKIRKLNHFSTGGLQPDLVVLLDLEPNDGIIRKSNRPLDRIENEKPDFHRRVRQGYIELAQKEDDSWLVVDASQPKILISELIWEAVSKLLVDRNRSHEGINKQ